MIANSGDRYVDTRDSSGDRFTGTAAPRDVSHADSAHPLDALGAGRGLLLLLLCG